jgi:hypothetical protein
MLHAGMRASLPHLAVSEPSLQEMCPRVDPAEEGEGEVGTEEEGERTRHVPRVSENVQFRAIVESALSNSYRFKTFCLPALYENVRAEGQFANAYSRAHRGKAVHLWAVWKMSDTEIRFGESYAYSYSGEAVHLRHLREIFCGEFESAIACSCTFGR